MTIKKNGRGVAAFLACLMLLMTVCASAAPVVLGKSDVDARTLGEVVILEDPALMGAMEEDATEPPETEQPTQEPTTAPTSAPTASYEIHMEPPTGWYATRAVMEMTIDDLGGTGWNSVQVTMERGGSTVTLIDGALPSGHIWIDLLENCVVEAVVTDPSGGQHSKRVTVACFDREVPSLTASVKGEYLYIEAADRQSGVAAVQVNGTTYTELEEGKLEIWLKEYADAYEQLIVQAVDKVGNVSKAIAVANPFFKNKGTPTPAPTHTPKPTNTPKPTKKPSEGDGGSQGSGNGGGKATATPTPTPTATMLPLPMATIDTGFPFSFPGNSYTRDLLYDKYTNKQFIAIETRGGDVFYLVIDYDKPMDDKGERYETYFLNMVDSRDMLDISGETKTPEPEIVYVTPEPTVQPTPAPVGIEPEKKPGGSGGVLVLLLILAAASGGAFWYFKIRKPSGGKGKPQFDDYGFDYEDDEPEEELVNEDE